MSIDKIDSGKHPVRYYLVQYYKQRWGYKFGLINPLWIPLLRKLKKEVSILKTDYTIIEEVNKEVILCLKTQQPNKIGRPSIEIFQRLEKI